MVGARGGALRICWGKTALPGRDFALKKCFALRRKADNAMHSFFCKGYICNIKDWGRSRPIMGSVTANLSSECVTSTMTPGTGDNTGGLPGKSS